MKLFELKITYLSILEELRTNEKFHKIYGNYCGYGNRGGKPIDCIDAACMHHDKCYIHGSDNSDCNSNLVKHLDDILNKEKLTLKQKVIAHAIRIYFSNR